MLWLRTLLLISIVVQGSIAQNVLVSQISDGQLQAPAATGHPTAIIDVGEVIGTTTLLPSATVAVNKFLGIPFAVSPPQRFSPPEPVRKFKKPVTAQAWSPACIQQFNYPEVVRNFTMAVYNSNPVPEEGEDCLYLNVYAPAATKKGRAVLFWIYGGTLEFGTASLAAYDGSSFAANQDVVVVTINYRTNVFGFSSSPELPVHARNVGFLDQRLGLDWVQRNIEAFGGDPSKVTIFGESSGAASVDRLVVSPPHPVPFRGAITESGQASVSAAPRDTGPASWAFLVAALGCNNAADGLACVRKADAFTIKGIVELNNLNFSPVTDNLTQLATPVNRSLHQSVPYMTGSNGQEGRILELGQTNLTSFTGTLFPESESLQQSIATNFAIGTPGITSGYDAVAQLNTEAVYQCPAAFVANESALAGFPTWRYYFNASFPNINPNVALAAAGAPGLDLQAYHSSEIRLVFGTYPVEGATAQEIALSKVMQKAWASFAKDPMAGPGWASYDSKRGVNPLGLAALGTLGSDGVKMISPYDVDYRCALFTEIYAVVNTPAF